MIKRIRELAPLLLLTAAHGAVDFYVGLLAVVAPGLALYLDIPMGDIVILIGAAALLNNCAQPTTGYIMGKRNMAWMLWIAVILAAFPVLMGFAGNMVTLSLLVLAGAIGTGSFHPEAALAAHEASGERTHIGIPMFMAGGAAIYAAGTPLAIKWTQWFGFPALAWFGLPGAVLGLLLLTAYRSKRRQHPSVVIRPRSRKMSVVSEGHMSYWPLLAVSICFGVSNGLFVSILSTHFELAYGGQEARLWAGWVLMVWGVAGSLMSFFWTALAARRGFFLVTFCTQIVAFPLFLLLVSPSSPRMNFLMALPLSLVSPTALYPVAVAMARNAAGLTQALRTSLVMGGTSGLSSIAVMAAGYFIGRGLPSSRVILFTACCSMVAVALSGWQLARGVRGAEKDARS